MIQAIENHADEIGTILNSDLTNVDIVWKIWNLTDNDPKYEHRCIMCGNITIIDRQCTYCPNCEYIVPDDFNFVLYRKRNTPYKRKIHFNEMINTLCSDEQFVCNKPLLDNIKRHLRNTDITPLNIRKALYRLGKGGLYKHRYQIYFQITNKKFITMTENEKEAFKELFSQVEIEFRTKNMKEHFFNYMYLINKFNELLETNITNIEPITSQKQLKFNNELWNKLLA